MSERNPKAYIELSRVSVAENTGAVFCPGVADGDLLRLLQRLASSS